MSIRVLSFSCPYCIYDRYTPLFLNSELPLEFGNGDEESISAYHICLFSSNLAFSFLLLFSCRCRCARKQQADTRNCNRRYTNNHASAQSPDNGDCPTPQPPPPPPECPPPYFPPPPPPKKTPPPPHFSPPPPPKKTPSPHPSPPSQYGDILTQIQIIKNRIKSDPTGITKTWTGSKICSDKSKYVGFICDEGRVVAFDFNLRNFSGGVPGNPPITFPELFNGAFKDLAVFHANSNFFTGDIPTKIFKLRKLFEFDLSNNKFNGTFPNAVLGTTNLEYLDLRYNNYTGPIPNQVFTLNLEVLFLNNNAFSGNIPKNLGQSPVVLLTLASNSLTGPIPKSIGQFRNLDEIVLLNNKLSGCLPFEIGFLNKTTTLFDVRRNQLSGPIPNSFGCLAKMQLMNLSVNHFYGIVPESLCCLENLVSLDLQFNYFTQVGVRCRELIKKGILDVSMNCIIDLPSQRSAAECKRFFSVRRTCPDPKSFEYEPCSIDVLSASDKQQETTDSMRKEARAASPAYQALNNNHD